MDMLVVVNIKLAEVGQDVESGDLGHLCLRSEHETAH